MLNRVAAFLNFGVVWASAPLSISLIQILQTLGPYHFELAAVRKRGLIHKGTFRMQPWHFRSLFVVGTHCCVWVGAREFTRASSRQIYCSCHSWTLYNTLTDISKRKRSDSWDDPALRRVGSSLCKLGSRATSQKAKAAEFQGTILKPIQVLFQASLCIHIVTHSVDYSKEKSSFPADCYKEIQGFSVKVLGSWFAEF